MRTILTILLLFPILLFSQDPGWEGAANTRFATPTYLRLGDSTYYVTYYYLSTHGGTATVTIADVIALQDSLDNHTDSLQSHNIRLIAVLDSIAMHTDSLRDHNARINAEILARINGLLLKRDLNNHDSLSTLDEKSYNSLTDKPTIPVGANYFAKVDSNTNANATTKKYVDDGLAGKQATGSYEVTTNKTNVTGTSTTLYATQNLVKTYADSIKTTIPSHAAKQDSVKNPFMFSGGNIVPRNGVTTIPYSSTLTKAVMIDTVTGKLYRKTMGAGGTGAPVDSLAWVKGSASVYLRDANDKVGIGTTAPGAPLHIQADVADNAFTIYNTNAGGYGAFIRAGANDNSKWALRVQGNNGSVDGLYVSTTGSVGINSTAPDEKLVVVGASTTGKYTSSGWTHSSDITMKDSIRDISNPLKKLRKLHGVRFVWKTDTAQLITHIDTTGYTVAIKKDTIWKDSTYQVGTATGTTTVTVKVIKEIKNTPDTTYQTTTTYTKDPSFVKHKQNGFLAQEAQNVVPEAVLLGKDGKLSMADNQILPVVVEGVKELAAEIDTLNRLIEVKTITPDTNGIKKSQLAKTMYISLSAPVVMPKTKQIADGWDGREITLVGMHNTNALTLHDGDNIQLSTNTLQLKKYQTLTLIWAAPLNTWIEKSRSLN